jgi:hypothetical protein
MNDALPQTMLTGPTLVEGRYKNHPCSCFTDPIDASQWGVSVEPYTDPDSGLNQPHLIGWRRASADTAWEHVNTFQAVIPRCPPLQLVETLRTQRGGFNFRNPDYLAACAALGLNPDPDPLFEGRPPALALGR